MNETEWMQLSEYNRLTVNKYINQVNATKWMQPTKFKHVNTSKSTQLNTFEWMQQS